MSVPSIPSGWPEALRRPRPPRLTWPPFRPAVRASSDVHSWAVPFSCAARPPLLAISRCFSGDIDANPRRSLRPVSLTGPSALLGCTLSPTIRVPPVRPAQVRLNSTKRLKTGRQRAVVVPILPRCAAVYYTRSSRVDGIACARARQERRTPAGLKYSHPSQLRTSKWNPTTGNSMGWAQYSRRPSSMVWTARSTGRWGVRRLYQHARCRTSGSMLAGRLTRCMLLGRGRPRPDCV